MSQHLLIVEDDEIIASGLCYALEKAGYSAVHCRSVMEALDTLKDAAFDLALLDMQLPDGTGFDVREALRESGASVIFLTVVDDEGNIVRAFEGGADDYITKPFRLQELLARIRRTLKARSGSGSCSGSCEERPCISLGKVRIDTAAGKAFINEDLLDLTALEYRLLLTFATHKGQVLSRAQILEGIWDSAGSYVEDNTLTVYIKRLREKLNGAATIETVRGLGYRAGQ